MAMLMMHVRRMWMAVFHSNMFMYVGVRLAYWLACKMFMLMVSVMQMWMLVYQGMVHVFMLVVFGYVKPDADGHKQASQNDLQGDGFSKEDYSR